MGSEMKKLGIFGVITLIIVVAGALFFSSSSPTVPPKPQKVDESLLVRSNSNKIATESAKLTVVEFGDFECPACRDVQPTVEKVIDEYKDKINFVFRNFPLQQHKNADIAAEAAEAAGAQGKYWEMHSKLYETQDEWANINNPLDKLVEYAKEFGLDSEKFKKDVASNAFKGKIAQDVNDAYALNVNSTPTFYIGGKLLQGPASFSAFKAEIDSQLSSQK